MLAARGALRALRAVSARALVPRPCVAFMSTADASEAAAGLPLPANVTLDKMARRMLVAAQQPVEATVAPVALPLSVEPFAVRVQAVTASGAFEETSDEVLLDPRVFKTPVRTDIVHRVVVWQEKNARTTLYKAKDRREVRGGGKKPWKQKGTGRARQGSTRSPIWRGGGVAHGAVFRDWSIDLPKKVRRLGLRIALSAKAAEGNLIIMDKLPASDAKTKSVQPLLQALQGDAKHMPACLLVDGAAVSPALTQAINNVPRVKAMPAVGANVRDVVGAGKLVLTRDAVELLTAHLTEASN